MWTLWWLTLAWAHQPGLSYARIEPDRLVLTFAERELDQLVPIGDPRAPELIDLATIRRAKVSADGAPCTLGASEVRRVENDGLEVAAALSCPLGAEVVFEAEYLTAFAEDHRQFVEVYETPAATLDRTNRVVRFAGAGDSAGVAWRFLGLGVEHILTGWDHLAFVAALVLGAKGWRQVLGLVTTFTVAHSLTLALAVTGMVRLPSSVVEPLIAASIAWVAIENFVEPPIWRRVGLTFVFGLIHGLGFAGLLAELGLPQGAAALALVAFNLGVEAGQMAAVSVLLLGLTGVDRLVDAPRRVRLGLSVVLSLAGVYWLVERVLGG
jgi:hypothetical protein